MNSLGIPDSFQEATDEQLGWIREIISDIISPAGLWPFVKSKKEILKEIDDEIARRQN